MTGPANVRFRPKADVRDHMIQVFVGAEFTLPERQPPLQSVQRLSTRSRSLTRLPRLAMERS